MKIVVAMDSFKGSISAADACHVVGQTISKLLPASEVVIKPMADGGEGTADAMMAANDGRWIPLTVTGPLEDMRVEAGFAWFDHDTSALVEMAVASGLQLLSADQLNPMKTTTYGTGQLIRAAMAVLKEKLSMSSAPAPLLRWAGSSSASTEAPSRSAEQVCLKSDGLSRLKPMILPLFKCYAMWTTLYAANTVRQGPTGLKRARPGRWPNNSKQVSAILPSLSKSSSALRLPMSPVPVRQGGWLPAQWRL